MVPLILAAILCALLMIARELRPLRKQHDKPESSENEAGKHEPQIFTFWRSGWILRVEDVNEWLGLALGVAIWFKVVMPHLPPEPLIRYPATVLGVLILCFLLADVLIPALNPIPGWMENYDKRVYLKVFSEDELKSIGELDPSDREEIYRQRGL